MISLQINLIHAFVVAVAVCYLIVMCVWFGIVYFRLSEVRP